MPWVFLAGKKKDRDVQATGSRWQAITTKEARAPDLPWYQLSSENNSSDPCGLSHTGAWDSILEPTHNKTTGIWWFIQVVREGKTTEVSFDLQSDLLPFLLIHCRNSDYIINNS